MCVMIDPMENYVITIKDQLCTITLESHSESRQQSKLSFMVTSYFIMSNYSFMHIHCTNCLSRFCYWKFMSIIIITQVVLEP